MIFSRSILIRGVKKPKWTIKTLFLTVVSFTVPIVFLNSVLSLEKEAQLSWFIIFDILTPLIVSIIVLLFQPIFVAFRNNTLIKAQVKIERIKSLSGLKVVAITGSYGKTSTKEFLTTILSKKFKVLSTKNHQNSEIGIAKCILEDLKPNHQIFIAEVGAYDKGKVKEVCSIIKPKIGVVTGVNEQHLALFGSLENLLSAEGGGELAEALLKEGLLVVNGDNKYCLDLYKKFNGNKNLYSQSNQKVDSDIWSDSVTVSKDNVSFLAIDKSKNMMHFGVRVLGGQNVQNLLGAILIAKELGMSFEETSEACKNILPEQGGMVLKKGKFGIKIIDSSYSANPDGVLADLDYLSIFHNKKIIIMPCIIELGDKSAEIHERIGRKIAEVCDLAIITSKDKFKEIERGFNQVKNTDILRRSDKNVAKCLLCDKPQDIYSTITLFCKEGDVILLEGRVPSELINLLT